MVFGKCFIWNDLSLEEFITIILEFLNQTCYVLNIKGKFSVFIKFLAGNIHVNPFHPHFLVNKDIQIPLSIKDSIIYFTSHFWAVTVYLQLSLA